MILKNNLQEFRWKKGWSQRELAQHSGVSYSLICQIENGIRPNPSITNAFLLAKALEVSVYELFYTGLEENIMENREEKLREKIVQLEKEVDVLWKIIETNNRTLNRMIDRFILKK